MLARKRLMEAAMVAAALFAAPVLPIASRAAETVEGLARIGEAEIATLDTQGIQERGGVRRFDVRVDWREPEKRPAGTPSGRVVRYLAHCAQGSLALAAVATLDADGRMAKTYVVPPGAESFEVPAGGSREAGWLAAACRAQ